MVQGIHPPRGMAQPEAEEPRAGVVPLLLAWLPVAAAILFATGLRFLLFLGTGNRVLAAMLGTLPSALMVLWLSRAVVSGEGAGRVRVALVWGVASAVFRALWVGVLLGGGWASIAADYSIAEGQSWALLLLVIVLAPLLVPARSRRLAEELSPGPAEGKPFPMED